MTRKEFVLLAIVSSISGLIGGAAAGRLFPDAPAMAQSDSRPRGHIQAEGFQLVDADGNTRAEFGLGPRGNPSLMLLDRGYKVRAKLALDEDGNPCLDLRDKQRRCRAKFMLAGEGKPVLMLEDGKPAPRADKGD